MRAPGKWFVQPRTGTVFLYRIWRPMVIALDRATAPGNRTFPSGYNNFPRAKNTVFRNKNRFPFGEHQFNFVWIKGNYTSNTQQWMTKFVIITGKWWCTVIATCKHCVTIVQYQTLQSLYMYVIVSAGGRLFLIVTVRFTAKDTKWRMASLPIALSYFILKHSFYFMSYFSNRCFENSTWCGLEIYK